MKCGILVVLCAAFIIAGCAKNNEVVLNPNDIPLPLPTPKETAATPKKVQVATGEMRELLLALERVHFAFDASTLSKPARDALDEASQKLNANPEVSLYVDGHTDNRGTTEYNLSLGEKRARTVVNYLNDLGVAEKRLQFVSFGEEVPINFDNTAMAYAQNRRVDFRVMKGDIQFVLEEGTLLDDKGKPLIARAD